MSSKKLISRNFPPYIPFASGKFRLSMGLTSLNLNDWLEPDEFFYEELLEKDRLLKNVFDEVFQARVGSELAQQEVFDLLISYMNEFYPELLEVGTDIINIKQIRRRFLKEEFRKTPLDLAGRLVQEDLCLMAPGSKGYTLEAASLCFPSRWSLLDKIGKPMSEIHFPVPGYKDTLAKPVDRLFERLVADKPVWRVNWSLTTDPDLYQPIRETRIERDQKISAENAGDKVFLRCERQTLRRLPKTGWILFTIKTYIDKISTLASKPNALKDLASLVRDLEEGMRFYKNISPYQKPLVEYLDRVYSERLNGSKIT